MNKSFNDTEMSPPSGQALHTDSENISTTAIGTEKTVDFSNPTQSTRKSILDLFGPEKSKPRKPKAPELVSKAKVNPLSPHQLDGSNTDLSDWENTRGMEQRSLNHETDPDEWAGLQRGKWESEEMVPFEPIRPSTEEPALSKEIRENYINIPKAKTRGKRIVDIDKDYSIPDPIPPSAWDYFYPPQPPPPPLSSSVQTEQDRKKVKVNPEVYDPFAKKQKQAQWPFLHNRDKLVEVCTNHLMRDGEKATAEKILQQMLLRILEHYPRRHPVTVLAEAIDRNAPLLKNVTQRDSGLKTSIVPMPLFEKQRIRVGWLSLVNAAGKSRDHGIPFPDRLAKEVIKVMEGRGAGLPFRIAEHKKAMQNKLNVRLPKKVR
jgi:small subunit ribosomal protein S7